MLQIEVTPSTQCDSLLSPIPFTNFRLFLLIRRLMGIGLHLKSNQLGRHSNSPTPYPHVIYVHIYFYMYV